MLKGRYTTMFASLAVIAAVQAPLPAQAQFWLPFFDWAQPVPEASVDWGRPAAPAATPQATAPAPRPQRVATVVPEPRRAHPRVLIVGVGF